jgi:hypothetical protein
MFTKNPRNPARRHTDKAAHIASSLRVDTSGLLPKERKTLLSPEFRKTFCKDLLGSSGQLSPRHEDPSETSIANDRKAAHSSS